MMPSPNPIPSNSLPDQLRRVGLSATAHNLDDFVARATQQRWSPRQCLEQIAQAESLAQKERSLERRLQQAKLGRFKPMADFDWSWPKKIDRDLLERALSLDFLADHRNLILIGTNGLGKTMIAKNIAFAALQSGFSVLFRNAPDLIADLSCDSPQLRRRKFQFYSRPQLLCVDEVGYLTYDAHAADLLYEIINRRYEQRSLLITTNRPFQDWNLIFPSATSIATTLDRLTHHADITLLDGASYRVRESELERKARRITPKR
jgi:DNA replication protein DnaC